MHRKAVFSEPGSQQKPKVAALMNRRVKRKGHHASIQILCVHFRLNHLPMPLIILDIQPEYIFKMKQHRATSVKKK